MLFVQPFALLLVSIFFVFPNVLSILRGGDTATPGVLSDRFGEEVRGGGTPDAGEGVCAHFSMGEDGCSTRGGASP